MKFVWIKNGTFTMGSPESEKGRLVDETAHLVTISKDYHLSIHETTQAQYQAVMGENNSYFQGSRLEKLLNEIGKTGDLTSTDSLPADSVSWYDAQEFCRKLTELPEEKSARRMYRLPTEAEWEYACRAGNQSSYSFGESSELLQQYAWFRENSQKMPHPVGQKKQTNGASLICTATLVSGVQTKKRITLPTLRKIRSNLMIIRPVLYAAATGEVIWSIADRQHVYRKFILENAIQD